jgi:hypothetical protein
LAKSAPETVSAPDTLTAALGAYTLQSRTAVDERASDPLVRYARQALGWLADPSVSVPDAENEPLTNRSSVAVGSIWKVSAALVAMLPST